MRPALVGLSRGRWLAKENLVQKRFDFRFNQILVCACERANER